MTASGWASPVQPWVRSLHLILPLLPLSNRTCRSRSGLQRLVVLLVRSPFSVLRSPFASPPLSHIRLRPSTDPNYHDDRPAYIRRTPHTCVRLVARGRLQRGTSPLTRSLVHPRSRSHPSQIAGALGCTMFIIMQRILVRRSRAQRTLGSESESDSSTQPSADAKN